MHHAPATLIWLDRVASGNTVLARGKERVRHVALDIGVRYSFLYAFEQVNIFFSEHN